MTMIDNHAPAWHTTANPDAKLAAARDELTRLTDSLRWVEHRLDRSEAAHEAEKDATRAAEERAQAETDRADGAEAHLRAVLVEFVIEPKVPMGYPELSEHAAFDIAESLIEDMNGGTKVEDLDPSGHIEDWAGAL